MSGSATDSARRPIDYAAAQAVQAALAEKRREGRIPDVLWLLEHPPTITHGSSGGRNHVLVPEGTLQERGIELHATNRGGDVTFHEPGQLVGYPIVDIGGEGERDLHAYLRAVEGGIIGFLAGHGIRADRVSGRTGVWVDGQPGRKIAAIGVRAKGWVTSHGFALNVENGLEGFGLIVPCGIRDAAVTSLAREVAAERLPSWDACCRGVHAELERSLGRKLKLLLGVEGLLE